MGVDESRLLKCLGVMSMWFVLWVHSCAPPELCSTAVSMSSSAKESSAARSIWLQSKMLISLTVDSWVSSSAGCENKLRLFAHARPSEVSWFEGSCGVRS